MILLMSLLAATSGGAGLRSMIVILDASLYLRARWYAVDVPNVPAPMMRTDGSCGSSDIINIRLMLLEMDVKSRENGT